MHVPMLLVALAAPLSLPQQTFDVLLPGNRLFNDGGPGLRALRGVPTSTSRTFDPPLDLFIEDVESLTFRFEDLGPCGIPPTSFFDDWDPAPTRVNVVLSHIDSGTSVTILDALHSQPLGPFGITGCYPLPSTSSQFFFSFRDGFPAYPPFSSAGNAPVGSLAAFRGLRIGSGFSITFLWDCAQGVIAPGNCGAITLWGAHMLSPLTIMATRGAATLRLRYSVDPPIAVDAFVPQIEVGQVIWDPDLSANGVLDLVEGKSATVKAMIQVSGPVSGKTQVAAKVLLDGVVVSQGTVEFDQEGGRTLVFPPFVVPAGGAGPSMLEVAVDPLTGETDIADNLSAPRMARILRTQGLKIAFIPILVPAEFTEDAFIRDFVARNMRLVEKTYPVPDGRAFSIIAPAMATSGRLEVDLNRLARRGLALGASRVVGLVPPSYFCDVAGFSNATEGGYTSSTILDRVSLANLGNSPPCGSGSRAVSCRSYVPGQMSVCSGGKNVAHELGHALGIGAEEDRSLGNPAPGYDVLDGVEVTGTRCLMGTGTPADQVWIDRQHYQFLLELLAPKVARQ